MLNVWQPDGHMLACMLVFVAWQRKCNLKADLVTGCDYSKSYFVRKWNVVEENMMGVSLSVVCVWSCHSTAP